MFRLVNNYEEEIRGRRRAAGRASTLARRIGSIIPIGTPRLPDPAQEVSRSAFAGTAALPVAQHVESAGIEPLTFCSSGMQTSSYSHSVAMYSLRTSQTLGPDSSLYTPCDALSDTVTTATWGAIAAAADLSADSSGPFFL